MAAWHTTDVQKGGEAYWLTRLGMLVINSVRKVGLPDGSKTFQIKVPTVWDLANSMYDGEYNEVTSIKPNEQPQFVDAVDDV